MHDQRFLVKIIQILGIGSKDIFEIYQELDPADRMLPSLFCRKKGVSVRQWVLGRSAGFRPFPTGLSTHFGPRLRGPSEVAF